MVDPRDPHPEYGPMSEASRGDLDRMHRQIAVWLDAVEMMRALQEERRPFVETMAAAFDDGA